MVECCPSASTKSVTLDAWCGMLHLFCVFTSSQQISPMKREIVDYSISQWWSLDLALELLESKLLLAGRQVVYAVTFVTMIELIVCIPQKSEVHYTVQSSKCKD